MENKESRIVRSSSKYIFYHVFQTSAKHDLTKSNKSIPNNIIFNYYFYFLCHPKTETM